MTQGFLGFGADEPIREPIREIETLEEAGLEHIPEIESVTIAGDENETFVRFLGVVSDLIQERGWLSKSEAYRQNRAYDATASVALDIVDFNRPFEVSERAKREIFDALTWVYTEWLPNQTSDYARSVRAALAEPGFNRHKAAITAPIVSMYQRSQRQTETKNTNGTYVGQVGKRETFTLWLDAIKTWEGNYGMTYFCRFHDADGNIVTWPASTYQNIEPGDCYQITGTVKQHKEFRGEKQTILTRCKLTR